MSLLCDWLAKTTKLTTESKSLDETKMCLLLELVWPTLAVLFERFSLTLIIQSAVKARVTLDQLVPVLLQPSAELRSICTSETSRKEQHFGQCFMMRLFVLLRAF
ncbi:hypothetical protein AMECASPLE_008874 [Ameca splendens]|uniref:Cytoskeleton-associated protein 5 n=1 Tax=Ameca splendens TaxID=208324 RepID=A0ABV0XZY7_9TELE